MKGLWKGLAVAAIQVTLVGSVGIKYAYDRATRPRVWTLTEAYDQNMPVRGRYLRLRVGLLGNVEPVPFFLPELAQDPTQLAPGEELWVEVTLPKSGPPRAIRLAVKRGDDFNILPN
jgi:hypothetical protein